MNKIIDEQTAKDLLVKLPLVFFSIPRNEYDIMLYRLYGEGEGWRPYKLVAKKFNLSPQDIGLIEDKVIKLINQSISNIFACGNCGRDLRKSGISIEDTGVQRFSGFIGDNGFITRENNHSFYGKSFKGFSSRKISCGRCSYHISSEGNILQFVDNGMNRNTILHYLEKTGKDIKEIPMVKKIGSKQSYKVAFDELMSQQMIPDFSSLRQDYTANYYPAPTSQRECEENG